MEGSWNRRGWTRSFSGITRIPLDLVRMPRFVGQGGMALVDEREVWHSSQESGLILEVNLVDLGRGEPKVSSR